MSVASTPHRWRAMAAIALGTSLVIMDATIANVALPVVIEDLGMSATQAQWVGAVYALVFASLMLTSGRLGDLFGRKRMFDTGLLVFMVSSVVAGAAGTPMVLLIARLVQGIGAAMVLPATASTINTMFTGRDRGIAFAIYGSTIGGMAAVGPLVGGWLATDVSWRWAFWLNIPFGLVALALAYLYLPETRDPQLRRGLDVPGTLLASLGLAAIVFGLIESSQYGWIRQDDGSISPVIIAVVGGVGLMVAWVIVERARERAGKVVQSHLGLWRIPNFRNGAIASFVIMLGEFGMLFTMPLVLQGAMGWNPLKTGWLMMMLAFGTFIMSAGVPHLANRLGTPAVVRIGVLLEAVAVAGIALTLPGGFWVLAGWLFLYGLGVGMATAQVTNIMLADVPKGYSGEASGTQTTVRQLGSAMGIAVLGGLLIASLSAGTADRMAAAGVPEPMRTPVESAVHDSIGAAIPALRENPQTAAAADAAADALVHAAKVSTGFAAGILAVGFLATLGLKESPGTGRREDEATESAEDAVDRA
ncbi:MAG: MFS transporter [Propionibacteriaceae bacterium]|nr:MFS transporter [Propionibacteriaceae bacterium]